MTELNFIPRERRIELWCRRYWKVMALSAFVVVCCFLGLLYGTAYSCFQYYKIKEQWKIQEQNPSEALVAVKAYERERRALLDMDRGLSWKQQALWNIVSAVPEDIVLTALQFDSQGFTVEGYGNADSLRRYQRQLRSRLQEVSIHEKQERSATKGLVFHIYGSRGTASTASEGGERDRDSHDRPVDG